jgi:hypothetical protein
VAVVRDELVKRAQALFGALFLHTGVYMSACPRGGWREGREELTCPLTRKQLCRSSSSSASHLAFLPFHLHLRPRSVIPASSASAAVNVLAFGVLVAAADAPGPPATHAHTPLLSTTSYASRWWCG